MRAGQPPRPSLPGSLEIAFSQMTDAVEATLSKTAERIDREAAVPAAMAFTHEGPRLTRWTRAKSFEPFSSLPKKSRFSRPNRYLPRRHAIGFRMCCCKCRMG
jgi:hypothetical protein